MVNATAPRGPGGRPKGAGGVPLPGLGEVLRRKGLNKATAAERTGVSPDTMSDLVRGTRGASRPTIEKLCAGLGVEVEELTRP